MTSTFRITLGIMGLLLFSAIWLYVFGTCLFLAEAYHSILIAIISIFSAIYSVVWIVCSDTNIKDKIVIWLLGDD